MAERALATPLQTPPKGCTAEQARAWVLAALARDGFVRLYGLEDGPDAERVCDAAFALEREGQVRITSGVVTRRKGGAR